MKVYIYVLLELNGLGTKKNLSSRITLLNTNTRLIIYETYLIYK